MYTYVYAHVRVHGQYTGIQMYTHTCMYMVNTYVYTYVYAHIMYVYMYIHVYVHGKYTCIHMYTRMGWLRLVGSLKF